MVRNKNPRPDVRRELQIAKEKAEFRAHMRKTYGRDWWRDPELKRRARDRFQRNPVRRDTADPLWKRARRGEVEVTVLGPRHVLVTDGDHEKRLGGAAAERFLRKYKRGGRG